MRVELPESAWAEVLDEAATRNLPEGIKRPIRRMINKAIGATNRRIGEAMGSGLPKKAQDMIASNDLTDVELDLYDSISDAMIVSCVVAWSYEAPVELASLADLPGVAYDVLREHLSDRSQCFNGLTDFSPAKDESSPT